MTTTHAAIRSAEQAYNANIDRFLFNLCDFKEEEVENLPEEYFLFDYYIQKYGIRPIEVQGSEGRTFYFISTHSSILLEYSIELDAYFQSYEEVRTTMLAELPLGGQLYAVYFKEKRSIKDAEAFLLHCFGYVAYCIEKEQEILTNLPF